MRAIVEYKKMVVEFIWSSKRSKIAYNLLIQDIKFGGLRLSDLETRIRSNYISLIKSAWLNPEVTWALILKEGLKQNCIHTLLASKAHWENNLSTHYTMLRALLKSWAMVHNFDPDTEEMVQHEILWNKKEILVAKEPVYWQRWYQAGIKTVANLLHDQEPCFLSHEEIEQKYGVPCTFLSALQLRTAIPVRWKRPLINPVPRQIAANPYIRTPSGEYLKVSNSSSKVIYSTLIQFRTPTSVVAQQKWATIFPELDPPRKELWKDLYQSPYRATRETKYQAFQYKIAQRVIPCNAYLANIRIKQTNICTFCEEVDSIQHFLIECEDTWHFWTQVCRWMDQNTGLEMDVSAKEILLGVHPTVPNSRKINFIAIQVKFFILRQKLVHNGSLPLVQFLREFRTRLQMEKQICFQEGKSEKFRCWERTLAALG